MRRCLHDKAGAVISLIVPCVDGGFIHWFHGRTRLHESPGRLDDNLIGELVPFEPDYRPVQHDIKGIPCVCVCVLSFTEQVLGIVAWVLVSRDREMYFVCIRSIQGIHRRLDRMQVQRYLLCGFFRNH